MTEDPFRLTYSLPGGGVTAASVDSAGDVYFGGTTSVGVPTTPGAFQGTFTPCPQGMFRPSCNWAFVGKLSPAGDLIWLTYLADPNGNSTINVIAADSAGNVYVAGAANPVDNLLPAFPVTPGAFSTTGPGPLQLGVFLAELNPSGTRLIYATYFLGGSEILSLVPDQHGNLYFGVNGQGLPLVNPLPGMAASTSGGYVAKMNPAGTGLLFASWISGNASSGGAALERLVMDPSGNLYIAGVCAGASVNCIPTTPGAFQPSLTYPSGMFAIKLTTGGTVAYATFLGSSAYPWLSGVAVDAGGNLTLAGEVQEFGPLDFPVSANAFQTSAAFYNNRIIPQTVGFVSKFNSTGSKLLYSTYFAGSSGEDGVGGVFLDTRGNAVFKGIAASPDLPVTSSAWLPCHPAADFRYADGPDADYIAKLSGDGHTLLYSGYLGTPHYGLGFAGVDAVNDLYFFSGNQIMRYRMLERPIGSAACVVATNGYGAPLAPLEIVRIRGNNVARERTMSTTLSAGLLPASYQGLQVLMNGQVAPLLAVEPDQITVVAPATLPAIGTVNVQVIQNGRVVELAVAAAFAAPVIITTDGLPYGAAVAVNQDGTPNSFANQAAQGSVVALYVIGLGATSPLLEAGAVASGPGALVAGVQVQFYGTICPVVYAGPAPGEFVGIYQVNFQIPAAVSDPAYGGVALIVQLGQSQLGSSSVWFYFKPARLP